VFTFSGYTGTGARLVKRGAIIIKVQTVKRIKRLREWAAQVEGCQKSGMTVRQWCIKQGVNYKTFYNRMRVLREEMIELAETGGVNWITGETKNEPGIMITSRSTPAVSFKNEINSRQTSPPEFVELSAPLVKPPEYVELSTPQVKPAAVTVRYGGYVIDIQNNADKMIIEHVLRLVVPI
jgi:hypothetical protein